MSVTYRKYTLLIAAMLLITFNTSAQSVSDTAAGKELSTDTTLAVVDPLPKAAQDSFRAKEVKPHKFEPKPKKAGMYSAILPGSGQFYNRQYWKVPAIYVGVAAAGYFINFNLTNYQKYRKAYYTRIDNDPTTVDTDIETKKYTTENLKQLQDQYRKWLDMTVLLTALGYTVQVIDAIASAHLKNFDISRDISLRIQPVAQPNYIGMGLAVNFK
ncbi:MAG TPA: DUF5683 domain-containing protein [Flavipsychrobacter sp.]|nr:DUF5683 domain-containing protein [Flavipsychrobacter sp.]